MDGAAALALMLSAMAGLLVGVASQQRVCYSGPPPEPDPDHPEDWMKQVMQEIRKRCPGRRQPAVAECSNPQPLGMEDGTIQDTRITASSSRDCCPASEARLSNSNRWIPASDDFLPWIEVDLIHPTVVSGIITQGLRGTHGDSQYVEQFRVSYQKQPTSTSQHVLNWEGDIKECNKNWSHGYPALETGEKKATLCKL